MMRASIQPASPSSTPSCRRSGTPACSAPSPGSTAATVSRIIYATSRGSGPIFSARWRIRRLSICATGISPTSRRPDPEPDLPAVSHRIGIIARKPPDKYGAGARQMAVKTDQRGNSRVVFERGISAQMMGIDGTWRRECTMEDVSESGAKLTIDGSVEGLHLKEFFLLLSSTGLAYRRCELAWVNGDQIGVNFLKIGDKKKKARSTTVGA